MQRVLARRAGRRRARRDRRRRRARVRLRRDGARGRPPADRRREPALSDLERARARAGRRGRARRDRARGRDGPARDGAADRRAPGQPDLRTAHRRGRAARRGAHPVPRAARLVSSGADGDLVDHQADAAPGAARARARRRAVRGRGQAGVRDPAQDVARRAGRAVRRGGGGRARSPRPASRGPSAPSSCRSRTSRGSRTRLPTATSSGRRHGAMPELPEVETIVRGLAPRLRGRHVESVWWSGQALHLRRKVDLAGLRAVAVGHAIAGVRRVGKFILIAIDDAKRRGHPPRHDRAAAGRARRRRSRAATPTSRSGSPAATSCASRTRAASAGSNRAGPSRRRRRWRASVPIR